ncbi:MAG: hypothetical protein LBF17_06530 [Mediterranea sp.]|jgi:hypothetical protein|nr:hypothetical protein [Mediterranea sp.]
MMKEKKYILIIKGLNGLKIAALLFFLISGLFYLSCSPNEDIISSVYRVSILNRYFEPIDSVCLGDQKLTDLLVGEENILDGVTYGTHILRCYTHSNLEIKCELQLIGTSSDFKIAIDEHGKVVKQ